MNMSIDNYHLNVINVDIITPKKFRVKSLWKLQICVTMFFPIKSIDKSFI
jgi:hypothetical protein